MSEKLITNISFSFKGKVGRERKSKNQMIHLALMDGHIKLDQEQKESFYQKAKEKIRDEKYRVDGYNCILHVNHGREDEVMRYMDLLPVQQSLFSKSI